MIRIYLQVVRNCQTSLSILHKAFWKESSQDQWTMLNIVKNKPHKEPTDNAFQIFHMGGDHWIYVTTISASGKRILVYDSGYTKSEESALSLLNMQFWCSLSNISVLKGAQKQQRGKECGLYAIANATSIAFGKNPLKLNYNEVLMREHLLHCFSNKI